MLAIRLRVPGVTLSIFQIFDCREYEQNSLEGTSRGYLYADRSTHTTVPTVKYLLPISAFFI